MARLAAVVHVRDAHGVFCIFGPADEVPEWAQALITNPTAWEVAPSTVRRLTDPSPAKKAPAKRAAPRRKVVGNDAAGAE